MISSMLVNDCPLIRCESVCVLNTAKSCRIWITIISPIDNNETIAAACCKRCDKLILISLASYGFRRGRSKNTKL